MTVGQQSCNGTGNRRTHQLRCAEDSDGVLARLVVQALKIKIRQKERLSWKWICGGNPNNWIELLVPVHLTLRRGDWIQKQGRNWKSRRLNRYSLWKATKNEQQASRY